MKTVRNDLADILKQSNLEFFGTSQHKVMPENLPEISDVLLLDVRSREEFAALNFPFGILPNVTFMHIPIDELPDRMDEVLRGQNVVVFCPSNFRSTLAYAYLKLCGQKSVRILSGGYSGLADSLMPGKVYKHVSKNRK